MLSAVNLDNDAPFQANEIGNIWTDGKLSPKSAAGNLPLAKTAPKALFGIAHV